MTCKKVLLKDIADDIQTGPFGSQLHQSDYSDYGIPVIMPKDLLNGHISTNTIALVEPCHAERLNRHLVKTDDIVFARRGDVGRCAFVTEKESGWICGTGCIRVRINSNLTNPKFVFYQLQKEETIGWIEKHAVGATMLNLNTSIIGDVPVELPDLSTQNKIVEIISNYDKLIENNQKQIKLLEEAAQRLYKEWFVDLRFPGYENTKIVDGVPEGWKKDRADSFYNITIGKTPPRAEKQWFVNSGEGIPWLSISDMGNSGLYTFKTGEDLTVDAVDKHNIKVVPKGTVFVSFKLTVGRISIAGEDMCTNEAIAHFYVDDIQRPYTYCYLKNFEYDTLGNTSSISKAVNSKIIKSMTFIMPDDKILDAFSNQVNPILMSIKNKQLACLKLAETRDMLLPRLMSGEVEV